MHRRCGSGASAQPPAPASPRCCARPSGASAGGGSSGSLLETDSAILHLGDCREVLRELEPESIDSCVTDPPYELGFMGKGWDKAGVAFDPTTWAEVLRVLKPGAHLLAFGGTRTYHRMACAIEDAGFEIRDSLDWIYGTGFPKSLNVGEGRGTALKPAHEPIVLARKPLIGTVAANVERFGTGAINVDGCRIATTDNLNGGAYSGDERKRDNYSGTDATADASLTRLRRGIGEYTPPLGRFPANVLFSHLPDCGDECEPGCPVAELDRQSGDRRSTLTGRGDPSVAHAPISDAPNRGMFGRGNKASQGALYADSGGASRFFYVAKPSRTERDAGCEHIPACTGGEATGREDDSAGTHNLRAGAGRTGGARNSHPTVKPIDLMRYLVRLVTPPGGLVLDPFTGSGTTGCAALLEGARFVGCELDEKGEYLPIAEARMRHWAPEAFVLD